MPIAEAPEARPRPSGETLQFMQRMWELVHALDVRSKRMAKTLGVTGPQRLVIRIIGQAAGITAGEISSMLGMDPSTLTGIMRRLQSQRMVERTVDTDDRRKVRFELTARGLEIDRARKGTVEAAVRRAMARAEGDQLEHTLETLQLLVDELSHDR